MFALFFWAYRRDSSGATLIGTFTVGSLLAALMDGGCYRRRHKVRQREKRRLLKELALFDFENADTLEASSLLKAVFNFFDTDESGDLSRRGAPLTPA